MGRVSWSFTFDLQVDIEPLLAAQQARLAAECPVPKLKDLAAKVCEAGCMLVVLQRATLG